MLNENYIGWQGLINELDGVTGRGKSRKALCPAHNDNNPSLSVREMDDGLAVKCFAGCVRKDICDALGIKESDLHKYNRPGYGSKREPEAIFDYEDENRELKYQCVKFPNKQYRYRRPDGEGGWTWNLKGIDRILFRLPELLAYRESEEAQEHPVFVPEGEKDVDSVRGLDLTATCNPNGAGKWRDEYSQSLEGLDCVILPDNDEPGEKHGGQVAQSLYGKARSVKVLELPDLPYKGDVTNWLEADGTREELLELSDATPEWKPAEEVVEENSVLGGILHEANPLDFHALSARNPKQGLRYQDYSVFVVKDVMRFADLRESGLWFDGNSARFFNGEYWEELDPPVMKQFLGMAAANLGVPESTARYHNFRKDLYEQFSSDAFVPRPEPEKERTLINLKNGTLELTRERTFLRRFDRNDYLTYQLDFEYDTEAVAPTWDAYLERVLPDLSSREILAEYIGYVFARDLQLEKTLILLGGGRNGKSVFFDVITALLGRQNISHFSLKSLAKPTYRLGIENKLLNYASEISTDIEQEWFKQMTSGEPIEARKLYHDPILIRNYARLAFNANELPRDVEFSDAFFRRFLIIPFTQTIPEDEADPNLAKKIVAAELAGVFNWVLSGFRRLVGQEGFSKCEASEKAVAQYRRETDNVATFIEEAKYEKSTEWVTSMALYEEYTDFCLENGYNHCGRNKFNRRLESLGYNVDRKREGVVVHVTKVTEVTVHQTATF